MKAGRIKVRQEFVERYMEDVCEKLTKVKTIKSLILAKNCYLTQAILISMVIKTSTINNYITLTDLSNHKTINRLEQFSIRLFA